MSKAEKALTKILSGKQDKNTSFVEVESVLIRSGWKLDRVHGSHHIYRAADGRMLSLPKAAYVRQVREYLTEDNK